MRNVEFLIYLLICLLLTMILVWIYQLT